MVDADDSKDVFNDTITDNGQLCRLKTFVPSYSGTSYDDAYWTQSGADFWFYGMRQPIDTSMGGQDRKFFEQGVITLGDSKLYVPGSIEFDGLCKYKLFIGGSPSITTPYEIIPNGVINWNISGVDIYKKLYIRLLNGGSFVGQY